ncbi:MAG: hypothetical protein ACE5DX_05180 [Candidatus Dojkabacteria bacterium]
MTVYYLVNKYFRRMFWYLGLPFLAFLISVPFVLPLLYSVETGFRLGAVVRPQTTSGENFSVVLTEPDLIGVDNSGNNSLRLGNKDYRAVVLDEYFRRHESPLYGHGVTFVEACDKWGAPFDCTTLPGIAYFETRLCTFIFSHKQRNCWGFGGSGPNRMWFDSYADAIDLITDRLVNAYGPEYMTDPKTMQYVYCGPTCHNWGAIVQGQRYEINSLAIEMGYPPLIKD